MRDCGTHDRSIIYRWPQRYNLKGLLMARFSNGWVKLSRSLFDGNYDGWDIAILGFLIANANYQDGKSLINTKLGRRAILRGQILTTITELSNFLGFERPVIKRRLDNYVNEKIIFVEKVSENHNSKTIITILNYNEYQTRDTNTDTNTYTNTDTNTYTNTYTNTDTNTYTNTDTHIKEVKNSKNEKKVKKLKIKELNTSVELSPAPKDKASDLIAHYCQIFKQRFNKSPIITGKEAGAANNIFKLVGLEMGKSLITGYFALPDAWLVQRLYPIDQLQNASIINRIRVREAGIDITSEKAKNFEITMNNEQALQQFLNNNKKDNL